ncbi:hypothetical protein FRX31_024940, partial [Thalictrum thalictroides]
FHGCLDGVCSGSCIALKSLVFGNKLARISRISNLLPNNNLQNGIGDLPNNMMMLNMFRTRK